MRNLPTVTRALLWANILAWLLDTVLQRYGIQLSTILGLHFITASQFHWWQPFTYMFMHANLGHIFCNMFAVLMFAPVLEREWGGKRLLIYYIICGLGAAFAQEAVWAIMYHSQLSPMSMEETAIYMNPLLTIGASGAVFGILLAFGWLFPDVPMFILFVPIPIRARIFVIIYAAIELFAGIASLSGDNVAHFAHLGGMLFGLLVLLYWQHIGWREPQLWNKIKKLFHKHPRLDSSKDKDYSDYHYQKRV